MDFENSVEQVFSIYILNYFKVEVYLLTLVPEVLQSLKPPLEEIKRKLEKELNLLTPRP